MKLNKYILYVFFLAGLFSACKEDTRDGLGEVPDQAKVAIFNIASPSRPTSASVSTPSIGYYYLIDSKQIHSAPLISPRTTGYFLISPGAHSLTLDSVQAIADLSSTLPKATVKTVPLNVEANKYYSVYISGLVQSPEVLITNDDVTRPELSKVKIRFVNLSPDLGAVDFAGALSTVTTTRPVIVGNQNYNSSSDFVTINAGVYTFELRTAGSTTAVIPTNSRTNDPIPQVAALANNATNIPNFTQLLEGGKVYTFLTRGYRNPALVPTQRTVAPLSAQPVYPLSVTGVVNSYW